MLNNISRIKHLLLQKKNIKKYYYEMTGEKLDFNKIETFNEKLQVLKLNRCSLLMTKITDKYEVRDFIKEKGLKKYLNEFYGKYNSFDEINFDKLPMSFVLKVNHLSGGVFICKNKYNFDKDVTRKKINKMIKTTYGVRNVEKNYWDIKPCIIIEKYLEDKKGNLNDYKIFCFNGKPLYIQIDLDRFKNHTRCFYDISWEKQPFTTLYPLYQGEVKKPDNLDEMLNIAKILSDGFKHIRVDLYNIDYKKVIFGELTFFHGSGIEPFYPKEWNKKLGNYIDL